MTTSPLHFFYMDAREMSLTPELRIRRISRKEKYVDGVDGGHYGWGLTHGYVYLFFAVDWFEKAGSGQGQNEIERAAASLLLFKPDIEMDGELPSLRLEYGGYQPVEGTQLPSLNYGELDLTTPRQQQCSYILGIDKVRDFRVFWNSLSSKPWLPNVFAAGYRLLLAQNRMGHNRDEDRLIDFIIAFEALVVRKYERGKAAVLSERAAKLTKLTGHLLQRATDQLELAYDLRNDVVHDGFFDPNNLNRLSTVGIYPRIDLFLTQIEQYLRIGMKEYILLNNQGLTKDQIIQTL